MANLKSNCMIQLKRAEVTYDHLSSGSTPHFMIWEHDSSQQWGHVDLDGVTRYDVDLDQHVRVPATMRFNHQCGWERIK